MRWRDGALISGELAAVVAVSAFAAVWMYQSAVLYDPARGNVVVLTAAEYEQMRLTMEAAQRGLTRACGGR